MIDYEIVHHVPGRIRLKVPSLKGRSIASLMKLSTIPLPYGITDVHPNPWTGSLVVQYDPAKVNIVQSLNELASRPEIVAVLCGISQ